MSSLSLHPVRLRRQPERSAKVFTLRRDRPTIRRYCRELGWERAQAGVTLQGAVAITGRGAKQMRSLDFSRYALIGVAAAVLAGCGGSQRTPAASAATAIQWQMRFGLTSTP